MLRGIRNASSNWLGRTIMGVVMGVLALSFAVWGINDIFRGFGRSTLAKVGGTEIPIEQFRQTYNDRLQQISRQIGRPLLAGTGQGDRSRPPVLQEWSPRPVSTSARGRCGSAFPTPRSSAASPKIRHSAVRPASSTATASSNSCATSAMTEQRFVSRAAPADVAAADRRIDHRRLAGAESLARSGQRISEPAAQHRICDARPGAGRRHSAADARNSSASISRSAKSCSARRNTARSKLIAVTPAELGKLDGNLRRRHQGRVRRAPQPLCHAGAAARRADRVSEHAGSRGRRGADQGWLEFRRARRRTRPQGHRTSISAPCRNPKSSIRPSPTPPSRSRTAK